MRHNSLQNTLFCKSGIQMVDDSLCGLAMKLSQESVLTIVVCNLQVLGRIHLKVINFQVLSMATWTNNAV